VPPSGDCVAFAPSFNMERVKVRTSLHVTFPDIKLVIFLINEFSLSTAVWCINVGDE
jgi:hypothetical protein